MWGPLWAQWDTKLESYQAVLVLAEAIAALEDEETKKKVEGILTKAKEAVWNAQTKTSKLQSQKEQNCCCMWGHDTSARLSQSFFLFLQPIWRSRSKHILMGTQSCRWWRQPIKLCLLRQNRIPFPLVDTRRFEASWISECILRNAGIAWLPELWQFLANQRGSDKIWQHFLMGSVSTSARLSLTTRWSDRPWWCRWRYLILEMCFIFVWAPQAFYCSSSLR